LSKQKQFEKIFEGTGRILGLSMIQGIVLSMGGNKAFKKLIGYLIFCNLKAKWQLIHIGDFL